MRTLSFILIVTTSLMHGCSGGNNNPPPPPPPPPPNAAPIASSVSISDDNGGSGDLGDNLTGSYVYSDSDGDAEGSSTFRWLRDGLAITGANQLTYQLTIDDLPASLTFEVTPVAASGSLIGTAVTSAPFVTMAPPPPNAAPIASNLVITDEDGDLVLIGDRLNATYSFSDAEGDAEAQSTYRWLRDGATIPGADQQSYTVTAADVPSSLVFEVTPIAASGTIQGTPVQSPPFSIVPPPADNATLRSLQIGNLVLLPDFDPTTTNYAADAPSRTDLIAVTAVPTNPNSNILINGTAATSVPIAFGDTSIAIEVTSEDGSTMQLYTVTVTRSTFEQKAYVKASNPGFLDFYGRAVAISESGNTFAVSANSEDSAASGVGGDQTSDTLANSGAAYVFSRTSATGWIQQAYIKASNPGFGYEFGGTMAMSADGNTLVVGSRRESSNATGINGDDTNTSLPSAGAAYVFVRDGDNEWSQQAYIKASNTDQGDFFASTLSLSGDGNTLAVGARSEDSIATGVNGNQLDNSARDAGAVYVYRRDPGGTWSQQAYLKASNTQGQDFFGESVALDFDGNTLAVGAIGEDSSGTGVDGDQHGAFLRESGAVYLFARTGNDAWAQTNYIKADAPGAEDNYGNHLALSGDGNTLAVAANLEDSASTGIDGNQNNDAAPASGAVYLYRRDSSGAWSTDA